MKEEREKISFRKKIQISKFRFWGGLIVSLLLSFSMYQFFIIGRDFLRLYTFSDNFNYLAFTDKELFFYNLFYAFLSLIIGQSYFLKIIFDTNKKFGEKKIQFKRRRISHDQNILVWFFLTWFFRLATMYGFFNMTGFGQNANYSPVFYESISFSEEYPYLFVLIIIVLFLQSWQNLGLTIQNYFRHLIISVVLISVIAFGFTNINLFDIESKFDKIHAENPYIKEKIQLPKVHFTETLSLRHKKKEFFITRDLKIIYNNQKLDTITFAKILSETGQNGYYSAFKPFFQLNVDENVSMKNLDKILRIINRNSNYQVAFSAYPKEMKLSKVIYQEHSVGLFEHQMYNKSENIIALELTNENEILLHNNNISCTEIANTIAKEIVKNQDYIITIKLKENASISDYLKLLSYAKEGYFKACKIIGEEKGFDNFTIEYFPNEIITFNSTIVDKTMNEPVNMNDYILPFDLLDDE